MSTNIDAIIRQMSNENSAKTFKFNSDEAQKARDFSERMSNTSHQREVDDLKLAGLNPVLSSNGGAQAYSASSASASADTSAVGVIGSLYQTKMNNDNAVKLAKMNIKQEQKNNKNALKIAKINQAASNYASNNSYAASRYASDTSASASRYGSDRSYQGHKYGVDRSKYGMAYNAYKGFTGKDATSSGSSARNTAVKIWNDFKTTPVGKWYVDTHNKHYKTWKW